jgi:hypothetical protein
VNPEPDKQPSKQPDEGVLSENVEVENVDMDTVDLTGLFTGWDEETDEQTVIDIEDEGTSTESEESSEESGWLSRLREARHDAEKQLGGEKEKPKPEPEPEAESSAPGKLIEPPMIEAGPDIEDTLPNKLLSKLGIKKAGTEPEEEAGPEAAGIDLAPPNFDELSSKDISSEENRSEFEKLLSPLPGPEVALLQQELEAEETVFVRIEKTRHRAVDRQVLGFIVGLVCLALFMVSVGLDYFKETLPGAPQPDFIPQSLQGDPAGAALFALGLLLPLLAVTIVADAVAYFLAALTERRIPALILSIAAAICAAGVFYALISAEVLVACGFLVAWVFIRVSAQFLTKLQIGRKTR